MDYVRTVQKVTRKWKYFYSQLSSTLSKKLTSMPSDKFEILIFSQLFAIFYHELYTKSMINYRRITSSLSMLL